MISPELRKLLRDSPYHKSYSEHDIMRTIVAPIRNNKAMIYDDGMKVLAFMSWAFLKPNDAQGYLDRSRKLQPADFKNENGELWFIDFIAPYGNVREVIRVFQREFQHRYPDTKFGKMFRRAKGYDARVIVRTK